MKSSSKVGLETLRLRQLTRTSHGNYISCLTKTINFVVYTFNSCTSYPDVCQCLVVQTLMDNVSKISQAQSSLRTKTTFSCDVVMYPCPGNWAEIGREVVYYARADQVFSAGIKCWHCITSQIIDCWTLQNQNTHRLKHSQATMCA